MSLLPLNNTSNLVLTVPTHLWSQVALDKHVDHWSPRIGAEAYLLSSGITSQRPYHPIQAYYHEFDHDAETSQDCSFWWYKSDPL